MIYGTPNAKIKFPIHVYYLIGVTQLPALITTGLTLREIGIPHYEIANCEPLHDLKNCIFNLLTELPHQIDDVQNPLQDIISKFCSTVLSRL